jgi:predicted nucleotide-binding protein (sugar kinase/HSP70/actin superfamily)
MVVVDFGVNSFILNDMRRIGMPRALLYYRYGEFWQRFLAGLGMEVVLSPPTDRTILEAGLSRISSEVCLPIKIVMGHLEALSRMVDMIFIPRLVWLGDHHYACPKMIGVVDVARLQLGDRVRFISPRIRGGLCWPHLQAGFSLTKDPIRSLGAYLEARRSLFRTSQPTFPAGQIKVAILSHFYMLEDPYIAQPILDVFRREGVLIYTKEDLPLRVLGRDDPVASRIQWVYERELYNAFRYYLKKVDGMCQVVSFGCGPDSLVSELVAREARDVGVPFLNLVIDEHTASAGLQTRIEAFIDMIRRQ